jgi:integrase
MKTTVKFKLRALRRVPGSGVLTLRITRCRATRTFSTSCVLSFREWNEKEQSIVFADNLPSKRKKELTAIKSKLKKYLKDVHEAIGILELRGDYTSQELVCCFRERRNGQLFCAYIHRKAEILRQEKRFGTAHAYRYAAVSFLKFLNGEDIHIKKITAALMVDYEHYLLSSGRSKNTVSCYMRSLRATYNRAIRENVFVVKKTNENPFSNVFTGNAGTKKRAIDRESISRLAEVELAEVKQNHGELSEVTGSMSSPAFSRDLFLFSFYTQGMCFSDMVNLKKENIKNGFIRYERKKTGQQITIELEDCMKAIIERYASSGSDFIFPILKDSKDSKDIKDINVPNVPNVLNDYENWKQTGAALATCNKNLRKLAGLAGINEHLTSYVARHSWASIASQENIPIATISRGLGHESEKTTRIYISQTDYSDVGRANRQILSHVVGKMPKTATGALSC